MKHLIVVALVAWLVFTGSAIGDEDVSAAGQLSAREAVHQGNQQLMEGNAPAALEAYGHAQGLRPDALEIPFVQGLGHYALKEYDEAKAAFEKAATSKDRARADDALYSVGTCYHAEALESMDDPQLAIQKLENALQRYQSVLASQPEHEAARDATVKAASLRRQIRQMLEQQQQQQEKSECDNPQEGDEKQEDQQENQSSEQKDEQQQDEQQQQQQENDESEEQQQSEQEAGQQDKQQEEEMQQADAGEQDEEQQEQQMSEAQQQEDASREQAQRRLRELMQAMRERQKHRRATPQPHRVTPVDKDW